MNYRANIVIFHEIAPLSARSSKKRTQKEGPAPAKWRKRTENRRPSRLWLLHRLSRSATNRAPPEVRKRAGSGWSARRAPRRNRAAQSPSRPCARSRNAVPSEKRRSKRLRPWAFFRLIGELFADRPHRVRHPRRRKKRDRKNRRKNSLAHARTTPSFCFSPSPICSNSMVHNALRVKISHILTQRNHHTTTSGSTACG